MKLIYYNPPQMSGVISGISKKFKKKYLFIQTYTLPIYIII